jgi:hypothetical protein
MRGKIISDMSTPRVLLFKPSKPKLTVSQLGDWDIISNLTARELGRELGLHVITGSIRLEKAKKIIVTVYRILDSVINFKPLFCWVHLSHLNGKEVKEIVENFMNQSEPEIY